MATSNAPANGTQPRPSHTLYCSNLPDKFQKDHLKRALYMLFSVYGPVLDVVCMKTPKMRGQAHVLFRDVSASTQAMRAAQGSEFFGKEMKIQYAKAKSDTLAKLDGTYKQPTPASASAAVENQSSSLQQSIFAGPPGTAGALASTTTAPPPSLKPAAAATDSAASPASQGVKRAREESDDEKEEAPMDMEDDEAMEESDPE
ncbi:hypothetical protein AAFC00_003896 [Neodothiora populina]|uniref:RRM domain-containing protein n=1 Tax=Neodothiora populina TaxID=2781224 RepID=A0ABR3PFQ1_9PEZI